MACQGAHVNSVHTKRKPPSKTLFYRLGDWVARNRWPVLIGYLGLLVVVGVLGVRVFGVMQTEGFEDAGSESSRASVILQEEFATTDPLVILAIETPTSPEADAAAAEALIAAAASVDGVDEVISYWSTGADSLLGTDGKTAQALFYAEDGAAKDVVSSAVVKKIEANAGDLSYYVFGQEVAGDAFTEQISRDIYAAEGIAIPITAVLLIFVFGSLVAAGLPFLVAGGTILGSFLALYIIGLVTDVSIFSLNLVTGLGLALGIDYSLLVINRFREELKKRKTTREAVAITVATAGKTVFVSGLAIVIALASLLVFPQYFLKSFAYAGIAVGFLAILGALTAIPALMAILGKNINKFKVRKGDLAPRDDGAWAHIARFVMRRPWPVLLGTTAILLVMAAPAFNAVFGQVDERALPPDSALAQAGEVLRERFPATAGLSLDVVLREPGSEAEVRDYAITLSNIPAVDAVTTESEIFVDGVSVAPNQTDEAWVVGDATRLEVASEVRPIDPAGEDLVADVRAVSAPAQEVLVGGVAAEFTDATSSVIDRTWVIALWLAIATIVILFLFTGSVLIPIKAIALNVLSLAATLGALVWVFQNGYLMWLTGEYTVTGTIDISTLALIGVIAFALSMDYEVFMLSRIKEEHDAGKDTTDAVALGLQRTGRIITAAALLIAIVFAAFLSSGATNIKQLGFGVTVAILLDATVVRALLVPSFMRIAGKANWWAPKWLRRAHERIGLREN
ncbi:MAG: MMPL family transporter [Actinobacteria bacterium]|nr:MMPL family transporter [Actinomycetota bacterium]